MSRRRGDKANHGRHQDQRVFEHISRPVAERVSHLLLRGNPRTRQVIIDLVKSTEQTIVVAAHPEADGLAEMISRQTDWPVLAPRRNGRDEVIGLQSGWVIGDVALVVADHRDFPLEDQLLALLRSFRITVTHLLIAGNEPQLVCLGQRKGTA